MGGIAAGLRMAEICMGGLGTCTISDSGSAHAPFKLVVREGKDHGWKEMGDDMKIFADWFDEHLRGLKPKE